MFTRFVESLRSIFDFKKHQIADEIGISSSMLDKHRVKPEMGITDDTSGLLAKFVIRKLDEKSLDALTPVRRQLFFRTVGEGLSIFEPNVDRPEVALALKLARSKFAED